jgi:hypothetical protein
MAETIAEISGSEAKVVAKGLGIVLGRITSRSGFR